MIVILIDALILILAFVAAIYVVVDGVLPWMKGKPVFSSLKPKAKTKDKSK